MEDISRSTMPDDTEETWLRQKVSKLLRTKTMNPQFQKLQSLLSSDPNSERGGEVMVRFDSGKEVPFHAHDTTLDDQELTIEKDASDGTVWYNGEKIEAVWLHKQSVENL